MSENYSFIFLITKIKKDNNEKVKQIKKSIILQEKNLAKIKY